MFLSLAQKRRSIRRYLEKPVETEKIERIVEAALRAPSSRGFNPWEFVVVTDPGLLEKLSKSKPHGASFIKDAAVGIVICADPEKCDVWIEDCSIAATFVQLAAHDIGLGSCWAQIRLRPHNHTMSAEAYVQSLLGIPGHLCVNMVIGIGYPDEHPLLLAKEKLDYGRIHYNGF